MNPDAWVNRGIAVRPGGTPAAAPLDGRTFIISGVGRGGTTMVAAALREAGIFLGEDLFEAALEDRAIFHDLRATDPKLLNRLIAERNARFRDWAFKVPLIHAYLQYSDLERFRNPHLILVFRDPLAIAARSAVSDYLNPLTSLRESSESLVNLVRFLEHTNCPALLVSYEKALTLPEAFIDALAQFTSLQLDGQARQRLLARITPNSYAYAIGTTVQLDGWLESLQNDELSGWCCDVTSLQPIELDLIVNERKVLSFLANRFRQDLLDAGYGNGLHGFAVDMKGFRLVPTDRLHVRVARRTLFELKNSGRTVAEYRQLGQESRRA